MFFYTSLAKQIGIEHDSAGSVSVPFPPSFSASLSANTQKGWEVCHFLPPPSLLEMISLPPLLQSWFFFCYFWTKEKTSQSKLFSLSEDYISLLDFVPAKTTDELNHRSSLSKNPMSERFLYYWFYSCNLLLQCYLLLSTCPSILNKWADLYFFALLSNCSSVAWKYYLDLSSYTEAKVIGR